MMDSIKYEGFMRRGLLFCRFFTPFIYFFYLSYILPQTLFFFIYCNSLSFFLTHPTAMAMLSWGSLFKEFLTDGIEGGGQTQMIPKKDWRTFPSLSWELFLMWIIYVSYIPHMKIEILHKSIDFSIRLQVIPLLCSCSVIVLLDLSILW